MLAVLVGVESHVGLAPVRRVRNNPVMQSTLAADLTVLERIARGDSTAVDACIKTYGGLVWSIARRYFKRQADAEDAVQEVFLDQWTASVSPADAESAFGDRVRRDDREAPCH